MTVQEIADSLGVVLSPRNASDSWLWDGQSVATHYNQWVSEYGFVSARMPDAGLLHELGHWLACSDPDQRLFPEFGLACGVVVMDALGTDRDGYRGRGWQDCYDNMKAFHDGLISRDESDTQEFVAQLLSVHWGRQVGCECRFDNTTWPSWDAYLEYKNEENAGEAELWAEAQARVEVLLAACPK